MPTYVHPNRSMYKGRKLEAFTQPSNTIFIEMNRRDRGWLIRSVVKDEALRETDTLVPGVTTLTIPFHMKSLLLKIPPSDNDPY